MARFSSQETKSHTLCYFCQRYPSWRPMSSRPVDLADSERHPLPSVGSLRSVDTFPQQRLRVAAISFLNTAPLMWDFQHPPLAASLESRYQIDWMLPAECANRLATGQADIGLVPIAALATTPGLSILPGCTIASKGQVRSLRSEEHTSELQSLRHLV